MTDDTKNYVTKEEVDKAREAESPTTLLLDRAGETHPTLLLIDRMWAEILELRSLLRKQVY